MSCSVCHHLYLPCKYSFKDLISAANGKPVDNLFIDSLYKLPQTDRNKMVKELCHLAGWYFEDVKGSDGIIYTAFSPITV